MILACPQLLLGHVTTQTLPTASPGIVADTGEVLSALLPQSLDEILWDTTQTEAPQQELGSIRNVLHTGPGVIIEHCPGRTGGGERSLGAGQGCGWVSAARAH